MITPGAIGCNRCFQKGLECSAAGPDSGLLAAKTEASSVPAPRCVKSTHSVQAIPAPRNAITNEAAKRSRLGTVMDVVCSAVDTSAALLSAGADKLHGILHDKVKFAVDRYTGAVWVAAFMTLKRRAVQTELKVNFDETCGTPGDRDSNSPRAAYRSYFTRMQGHTEDLLCKRAHDALESVCRKELKSVEQFHQSLWWIPAHIPQLNGPDAVYVTTAVLGVVSKHSNLAWDRLFRNTTELEDFLESSEDAVKSPLCKVGLFPFIQILNSVEDEQVLADKYFWSCGTSFKGSMNAHNSELDDYASHLEFTTSCHDKHGNEMECGFWITVCLQTSGALLSRTIRCIPEPSRLKMEIQQQEPKVHCAQITFTKPQIGVH